MSPTGKSNTVFNCTQIFLDQVNPHELLPHLEADKAAKLEEKVCMYFNSALFFFFFICLFKIIYDTSATFQRRGGVKPVHMFTTVIS